MRNRTQLMIAMLAALLLVSSMARAEHTDEIQQSDQRYAEIYAMRIELQSDLRERLEQALDRIARPYDFFVTVQIQVSGELHKIVDRETKNGMNIKVGASEQVKLPGLPTIKGPKGGGRNPNVLLKLPAESREVVRNELRAVIEKINVKVYVEEGASDEQLAHIRQTAKSVADLDDKRGDSLEVTAMASRQVAGRSPSGVLVARQSVWIFCATLLVCALVLAFALRRSGGGTSHMSGSFTGGGGSAEPMAAGGIAALSASAMRMDEDAGEVAAEGRFAAVRGLTTDDLMDVLLDVPPRTAAAMVGCDAVPSLVLAQYFKKLPPEARLQWVQHLAQSTVVPISDIEAMEQQVQVAVDKVRSRVKLGNAHRAADILSETSHEDARQVLDALAAVDPALVEAIRKGMMLFEDLPAIPHDEIREIVSTVDPSVMVVALQGLAAAQRDAILKPLSRRLRNILASEEEVTKAQSPAQVEAAQKQVEAIMRRVRHARRVRQRQVGA